MKRLKDIWDKLPNIEHTIKFIDEKTGLSVYEVCGKKFQETTPIKHIIPILEKYYAEYGERAILASKNSSIDWKAVSHAIRAAYQVKQLFTEGDITFSLVEAPFILDVKQGKLDYLTQVAPVLEGLMVELEQLSLISTLPETPDAIFWDNFLLELMENHMKGS